MGNIPADMLKVTLDIHFSLITKFINLSSENGCFPEQLKLAEFSQNNFRPFSVLFNVSKVFERITYCQIHVLM